MITYPPQVEDKLGFGAVRERLAGIVRTASGAERVRRLAPTGDWDRARTELSRAAALQDRLRFGDPVPEVVFDSVTDVLRRAVPAGAWLEPEDLAAVRTLLATVRRMHAWLEREAVDHGVLGDLARMLEPLPDLERAIDALIDPEGRVREDASDTLRRIRREAARAREHLRSALQDALRRASSEGWAVEEQPTIRGGRMVIPVRAEAKRKLDGIVHDLSATGQTAFVEPAACVELNNDLRTLEGEERREIIRLLTRATDAVRTARAEIGRNEEAATYLDVLVAVARLANEMDAVVPEPGPDGTIGLREARNPELLLRIGAEHVVPLDLELGADCRLLVISGPNAGGKSVALKTVGLFALMLACGMPVPCDPGSTFGRFDAVFVQLGDDQSVEDDLSTFSSQLGHIRVMLERADARSLVLLDEAGSGTDPEEGSALAQAALERLQDGGALVIASTHQSSLKRFAHDRDGACNGMMVFDRDGLRPTFRFEAGVPGASYAFEIAERIGVDRGVTGRARDLLGSERVSLEELLSDLQARNEVLERRIVEADRAVEEARVRREALEERLSRLRDERAGIRERALEEAEAVLRDANAEVERAVREIREAEAAKDVTRAARDRLDTLRSEVQKSRRRVARKSRAPGGGRERVSARTAERPLAPGDQVVLDGDGPAAEVQEIRGDEAVVIVGSARMRVSLDRLRRVGGPRRQQVTVRRQASAAGPWSPTTVRTRVDLRGRRADEAVAETMRLVDEALAAGLDTVEILHGKGTGALRAAIHEYLASRDDVVSFDEAPIEQGGAGVTIVHL